MAGPRRRTQVMEEGNADYGARLAKLRKAAGLSQQQLAESLGIAQSLISRYEKGQRRMYDDMLATTAKILGVTPNDILGAAPTKPSSSEATALTRKMVTRLKQIEALPRRSQDHVMGMLDMALKGATNSKAS